MDVPENGQNQEARDKTYFNYYGMLMHQQNMLQDTVRTSAYYSAVFNNRHDFVDKVVLDVGAGTGILSFFAAQVGARRVYAVEASEMARTARRLAKANGWHNVVQVVEGKVEEVALPEPVDVIISESMGVLLVHERMMESFLFARDKWLKTRADGSVGRNQMFPVAGTIYLAPFCDVNLYAELANRATFWQNREFFGVDLTSMVSEAKQHVLEQPVVGPFDPKILLADAVPYALDFATMTVGEIRNFTISFEFTPHSTGIMHGLAAWFDVGFAGSSLSSLLSTGPADERTHWHQIRFIFRNPIAVNRGQHLKGVMELAANSYRSHDVRIALDMAMSDIHVDQQYALQNQQYWNITNTAMPDILQEYYGIYPDDRAAANSNINGVEMLENHCLLQN